MSATLTAAQVSVREFLAQLCDDAAAGKAVDRAGPCAACSQTSDGWCRWHRADQDAYDRYAAMEKAVSAASGDAEALDVFLRLITGAGQP